MRTDARFPVRLRFAKRGKVRFISHRDVARAFERALRVEQVPLAFTQGFSPRPRVSFGFALSVGHESDAEYLDFEVVDPIELDDLAVRLGPALPEGIAVTGVAPLQPKAASLQETVTAIEYRVGVDAFPAADLQFAVDQALRSTSLLVATVRKGRAVSLDLRPLLHHLHVVDDGSQVRLDADVSADPRPPRPGELLAALRELAGVAVGDGEDRVLRTRQWIERDGARLEPLEADRALLAPLGASPRALEACAR